MNEVRLFIMTVSFMQKVLQIKHQNPSRTFNVVFKITLSRIEYKVNIEITKVSDKQMLGEQTSRNSTALTRVCFYDHGI